MKKSKVNMIAICSLVLAFFFSGLTNSFAQATYHAQKVDVLLTGTSSLHDWEMKSDKGQFDATIAVAKDKVIFSGLSFNFPAESLKSGHGAMDKNTYKALDTKKNPNISFVLTSGNVTNTGSNTYLLKGMGKLTISGNTILTDLVVTLKYNPADKSFTCSGTKKFKMTQYGVKPPTVMMGAIKTGDDVAITYNLTIKS
ncbi:MAG: YceI family protein [Ferruginibacter sp.]|nr:YceI family protein [Ferruginibacter sp.]